MIESLNLQRRISSKADGRFMASTGSKWLEIDGDNLSSLSSSDKDSKGNLCDSKERRKMSMSNSSANINANKKAAGASSSSSTSSSSSHPKTRAKDNRSKTGRSVAMPGAEVMMNGGGLLMSSTTKSARFGLNTSSRQLYGDSSSPAGGAAAADEASQSAASFTSTGAAPYNIHRDAKPMRCKQTCIDDIIRLTPLNTHKKSLRRSMVPYTSLYNKTLDDESGTMMMMTTAAANPSRIDAACRGYVTRKGLRRRRVTNQPDYSHLSMEGTIKSLTSSSCLRPMNYNSTENLQRTSSHNIESFAFHPGIQDNIQQVQTQLNQSLAIQQKIKKRSISEVFNSVVSVLDTSVANNTSSEHEITKEEKIAEESGAYQVEISQEKQICAENVNKSSSETKTESQIDG